MSENVVSPLLASRLQRLGTETSYKVSDESNELKKTMKIYPFHIGDLNFSTPKIFIDRMNEAIKNGKTGYCSAAGIAELREALAENIGKARGVKYDKDNVSIQSGGKPVIWKFLACTMEEGDEVLYPNPGYPIYESMIDFLGGVAVPYGFKESKGRFELDLDVLESKITSKTKVLIYNNHHNPTGAISSEEEIKRIAELCEKHNLWVLSDEAYFDITYGVDSRSIVSYGSMKDRTVILHTFSKSFCMTGWRLGAAIGPKNIIDQINKLNTNDEACTTHFIQYAGLSLTSAEANEFIKNELLPELKRRKDLLFKLLQEIPGFKIVGNPETTFYYYVNVTEALKLTKSETHEDFRRLILQSTGVSVCHREHFGSRMKGETDYYVRFAYSGITTDQIEEGLKKLKEFMEKYV